MSIAAAEVIGHDEEIDAAFAAIMRQLISYMMEDPRTISAALEIVFIAKSIERIGDHAKNIAEAVVQVVKGKDVRHATADQIRAEVASERGVAHDADRSWSSRTSPRSSSCCKVNLRRRRLRGARGRPMPKPRNALLKDALPDLVLLDWMLPGQSGLAFAQAACAPIARTKELPVIMVTARSDEADRVAGLEAWVDDYVTKPFSPRELKARIKSVLRRRAPEAAQEPLVGRRPRSSIR